jgi:hypothetical protein
MIRARPLSLLAAATALLSGCGHVDTHRVMFRGAPAGDHAAELYVERLPERPYAEIGLVQAIGWGNQSDISSMLTALQKEGRANGCDALVNARLSSGGTGAHAVAVCAVWAAR